jgi:CBS-domain-containing membrane protein
MQDFYMQKLKKLIDVVLVGYQTSQAKLREKLISSFTACFSILILLLVVQYVELGLPFKMLVLASMGASAFLLFVTPHSPMAQPWPVIAGHLVSALPASTQRSHSDDRGIRRSGSACNRLAVLL